MKDVSPEACRSGLICHQEWASAHLWGSGHLNTWIPHTPIAESEYMDFACRYLFLNCRFVRILHVVSPRDSQTHSWQLSWLTPVFSHKLPNFSPSCGLSLLMWAQVSCLQRWKYPLLHAQARDLYRTPELPSCINICPNPQMSPALCRATGSLGVLPMPRHTATTWQDLRQYV